MEIFAVNVKTASAERGRKLNSVVSLAVEDIEMMSVPKE